MSEIVFIRLGRRRNLFVNLSRVVIEGSRGLGKRLERQWPQLSQQQVMITRSKAFVKSTSRVLKALSRSRVDYHSWIIAINVCVVDLLALHPYCFSSNDGSKTD